GVDHPFGDRVGHVKEAHSFPCRVINVWLECPRLPAGQGEGAAGQTFAAEPSAPRPAGSVKACCNDPGKLFAERTGRSKFAATNRDEILRPGIFVQAILASYRGRLRGPLVGIEDERAQPGPAPGDVFETKWAFQDAIGGAQQVFRVFTPWTDAGRIAIKVRVCGSQQATGVPRDQQKHSITIGHRSQESVPPGSGWDQQMRPLCQADGLRSVISWKQ